MEGNLTEKDMDMIQRIIIEDLTDTDMEDDQICMMAEQIMSHIRDFKMIKGD